MPFASLPFVPLIVFSTSRTLFDKRSKYGVTSDTLRSSKKGDSKGAVICVRNGFQKFVEGRNSGRYELGVWASTTGPEAKRCTMLLEDEYNFPRGALFAVNYDRYHGSKTVDGEILKNYHHAGAIVKNLKEIWKENDGKYGPHNTILISRSVYEGEAQPRNLITVSDFDGWRVDEDNVLVNLNFLIEKWTDPNNIHAVKDARDLCDKISREPGFGRPTFALIPKLRLEGFLRNAPPLLLERLISRKRFEELGILSIFKEEWHQDKNRDISIPNLIEKLIEKIGEDKAFEHTMRYFVFNIGYLHAIKDTVEDSSIIGYLHPVKGIDGKDLKDEDQSPIVQDIKKYTTALFSAYKKREKFFRREKKEDVIPDGKATDLEHAIAA